VSISLEPEQEKLFATLRAAAQSVSDRAKREEFMFLRSFGGDSVQGNGLETPVLFEDLIALDDAGLIRVTQRHRRGGGFNFVVVPGAGKRFDEQRVASAQDETASTGAQREVSVPSQFAADGDPKAVMVVHGRNAAARDAMFAFLRRLGLNPLDWDDLIDRTGSAAPFIGEVLNAAFSSAQAVVVLLTPDDEARLRDEYQAAEEEPFETELTPQARPNVLFEAGMALASHPTRTVLVEVGRLRPFSDVAGRHVVRLTGSDDPLRAIARRLEQAGCAVDTGDDADWADPGQFPLPQDNSRVTPTSRPPDSETVLRQVTYLSEDTRRWIADRDRSLAIELAERSSDFNARGLLYSGAHGASLAMLRQRALHEYRDEVSRQRREYARIRAEAPPGVEVPALRLDEESLSILRKWREPVKAPGSDVAVPIDDPTDETREPDLRRFEEEGDGPTNRTG
jgi:predicted nucleotide-binding protein